MEKVFLVGYMGAGKTSLGKRLANKLSLQFLDLDLYIEEREGYTVREIFQNEGESYFRKVEHSIIQSICSDDTKWLVSTGGGTPCFHENMELMNSSGVTVYLKTSPEALHERLVKAKQKRPLLENRSNDEMLSYIQRHLIERMPYYEQSSITVDALSINAAKLQELVADINEKLF